MPRLTKDPLLLPDPENRGPFADCARAPAVPSGNPHTSILISRVGDDAVIQIRSSAPSIREFLINESSVEKVSSALQEILPFIENGPPTQAPAAAMALNQFEAILAAAVRERVLSRRPLSTKATSHMLAKLERDGASASPLLGRVKVPKGEQRDVDALLAFRDHPKFLTLLTPLAELGITALFFDRAERRRIVYHAALIEGVLERLPHHTGSFSSLLQKRSLDDLLNRRGKTPGSLGAQLRVVCELNAGAISGVEKCPLDERREAVRKEVREIITRASVATPTMRAFWKKFGDPALEPHYEAAFVLLMRGVAPANLHDVLGLERRLAVRTLAVVGSSYASAAAHMDVAIANAIQHSELTSARNVRVFLWRAIGMTMKAIAHRLFMREVSEKREFVAGKEMSVEAVRKIMGRIYRVVPDLRPLLKAREFYNPRKCREATAALNFIRNALEDVGCEQYTWAIVRQCVGYKRPLQRAHVLSERFAAVARTSEFSQLSAHTRRELFRRLLNGASSQPPSVFATLLPRYNVIDRLRSSIDVPGTRSRFFIPKGFLEGSELEFSTRISKLQRCLAALSGISRSPHERRTMQRLFKTKGTSLIFDLLDMSESEIQEHVQGLMAALNSDLVIRKQWAVAAVEKTEISRRLVMVTIRALTEDSKLLSSLAMERRAHELVQQVPLIHGELRLCAIDQRYWATLTGMYFQELAKTGRQRSLRSFVEGVRERIRHVETHLLESGVPVDCARFVVNRVVRRRDAARYAHSILKERIKLEQSRWSRAIDKILSGDGLSESLGLLRSKVARMPIGERLHYLERYAPIAPDGISVDRVDCLHLLDACVVRPPNWLRLDTLASRMAYARFALRTMVRAKRAWDFTPQSEEKDRRSDRICSDERAFG